MLYLNIIMYTFYTPVMLHQYNVPMYHNMYLHRRGLPSRETGVLQNSKRNLSLWTCPTFRRERHTRYPSRLTLRDIISISDVLLLCILVPFFSSPERVGCFLHREIQYYNLITRNRGFLRHSTAPLTHTQEYYIHYICVCNVYVCTIYVFECEFVYVAAAVYQTRRSIDRLINSHFATLIFRPVRMNAIGKERRAQIYHI